MVCWIHTLQRTSWPIWRKNIYIRSNKDGTMWITKISKIFHKNIKWPKTRKFSRDVSFGKTAYITNLTQFWSNFSKSSDKKLPLLYKMSVPEIPFRTISDFVFLVSPFTKARPFFEVIIIKLYSRYCQKILDDHLSS